MSEVIRVLRGPDRVRCRPAVIFGSDDNEGAQRAVEMLLGIMSSESMDDYSPSLIITLHDDGTIEMEDFGRGIYLGSDPDERWKEIFCELYARNRHEDYSLLGSDFSLFEENNKVNAESFYERYDEMTLCAVQYATEYMFVRIRRDGVEQELHFKKGVNEGGLREVPYQGPSGTLIRFKLDGEVFTEPRISSDFLSKQARRLALLIPGLKVHFNSPYPAENHMTYCYSNGIADYLGSEYAPLFLSKVEGKGQERYNLPRYTAELNIGLAFFKGAHYHEYYHNGRELIYGGAHISAIIEEIQKRIEWVLGFYPSREELFANISLVVVSTASRFATRWTNGSRRSIENVVLKDMGVDSIGDSFSKFIKDNGAIISELFTHSTER